MSRRSLLDVNVLIALFDGSHNLHAAAWAWFESEITHGWASCPITQNGFLRVITQPRYPNRLSMTEAMTRLRKATTANHHSFWPDSISLANPRHLDPERIHGPTQLTDSYLLALATDHGGRLVSFDRHIACSSVPGATTDHLLIL